MDGHCVLSWQSHLPCEQVLGRWKCGVVRGSLSTPGGGPSCDSRTPHLWEPYPGTTYFWVSLHAQMALGVWVVMTYQVLQSVWSSEPPG